MRLDKTSYKSYMSIRKGNQTEQNIGSTLKYYIAIGHAF